MLTKVDSVPVFTIVHSLRWGVPQAENDWLQPQRCCFTHCLLLPQPQINCSSTCLALNSILGRGGLETGFLYGALAVLELTL